MTWCKMALVALVEERFLWVTSDGHYMRATDGAVLTRISFDGANPSRS
jgi:hypothetical protein